MSESAPVSAIGRALIACVAEHDWSRPPPELVADSLDDATARRLVASAGWHRVEGPTWLSLRAMECGNLPSVRGLGRRHQEIVANHLQIVHNLGIVTRALKSVPHLVFKGPVLATDWYTRPDLRTYADLDVLVHPATFRDAIESLEEIGCVVIDRNWSLLAEVMAGQIHLEIPTGGLVDLHWSVLNDKSLREHFRVPTSDLFERSTTSSLGVRTFDSVDTLLHLALHGMLEGADRLVWLKDIEQVLERRRISWLTVVTRAREAGLTIPVALLLSRCRRALGASVPDGVVESLLPSRLARWVGGRVERLFPIDRAEPDGSVCRVIAKSCRSTTVDSVAEFRRRSFAWIRYGRSSLDLWDSRDPWAVTYDGGGALARDAYLRAVVALGDGA